MAAALPLSAVFSTRCTAQYRQPEALGAKPPKQCQPEVLGA